MIDRRGGPSSPGQVWEARKAAATRAWLVAYIVLLVLAGVLSVVSAGDAEGLVDPIREEGRLGVAVAIAGFALQLVGTLVP
jgi:hypothetical protein